MDPKIKEKRNVLVGLIAGVTLVALALPLGSASAALGDRGFQIRAQDKHDPEIFSVIGNLRTDGETEVPEEPETPDPSGVFSFTIDKSLCSDPGLYLNGVASDATIAPEGGSKRSLANGWNPTPEDGTWTVRGKFTKLGTDSTGALAGKNLDCLTAVTAWEDTGTTSASYAFYKASNLSSVPKLPSSVTNTSYMFASAKKFNGDISGWDTSNIWNMDSMFKGAENFNQNLSAWNTAKVTNMDQMFAVASSFNGDISNWDTSRLTSAKSMFSSATSFNRDLNWNTSRLTDASLMFRKASSFNGDISSWDTSKVTKMGGMFIDASAFNSNISGWNTSLVTEMAFMFQNAVSFNQDIGDWDTSSTVNMDGMFTGATSFNGNIGSWDVRKVTNMDMMFANATDFTQDLSGWKPCRIPSRPTGFDGGTSGIRDVTAKLPVWGACS